MWKRIDIFISSLLGLITLGYYFCYKAKAKAWLHHLTDGDLCAVAAAAEDRSSYFCVKTDPAAAAVQ